MVEKENLDIPMILTIGIVSTVLTAAAVLGVQALYLSFAQAETTRKVTLAPTVDADSKLAEQDAKLASYGWANRQQGQVVIPIDRAMELVTTDYAAGDNSMPSDSALSNSASASLEVGPAREAGP